VRCRARWVTCISCASQGWGRYRLQTATADRSSRRRDAAVVERAACLHYQQYQQTSPCSTVRTSARHNRVSSTSSCRQPWRVADLACRTPSPPVNPARHTVFTRTLGQLKVRVAPVLRQLWSKFDDWLTDWHGSHALTLNSLSGCYKNVNVEIAYGHFLTFFCAFRVFSLTLLTLLTYLLTRTASLSYSRHAFATASACISPEAALISECTRQHLAYDPTLSTSTKQTSEDVGPVSGCRHDMPSFV